MTSIVSVGIFLIIIGVPSNPVFNDAICLQRGDKIIWSFLFNRISILKYINGGEKFSEGADYNQTPEHDNFNFQKPQRSSNNNNKADSKQRQTLSSPKRENRITFSSYVYIQNFNWKAEIERERRRGTIYKMEKKKFTIGNSTQGIQVVWAADGRWLNDA